MSASQDGSESVDQFLARIASAKEGRDQASEERTRRMEEDFLKNRKERQARRLVVVTERARSLSPSKTGPSSLSPVRQNPAAARDAALNPPVDFSPRASTLTRSNAVTTRTSPRLEPKSLDLEAVPPPKDLSSPSNNTAGLSRSGTLSWQQRPPRDSGLGRPRPLSSVGAIRSVPKLEEQDQNDQTEPTRQEIAASLGMKDPSWFRQTQERGLGSAAFRRSQVEDTVTVEHTTTSQSLPGMSREGSRSATNTPVRDTVPSMPVQAMRSSPLPDDKLEKETPPAPRMLSDLPKLLPSPQQTARVEAQPDTVPKDLTRTGSILARRSPSPTKGLGGFVESAMMKRSDSVSKRWSVQANAGLKRGDSIAGMRPLGGVRSMHAASLSRTSNRDGSSSPIPTSRPESRDGVPIEASQTILSGTKTEIDEAVASAHEPDSSDIVARPKTPESQLSRSPSKTLDAKRWSPTKSSWLESALLAKPEPAKAKSAKDDIPAWKASLQRNKASKDLSPEKDATSTQDPHEPASVDTKKVNQPPVVTKKPDLKPKELAAPYTKNEPQPKNINHDEDSTSPTAKDTTDESKVDKPVRPVDSKPELTSMDTLADNRLDHDTEDTPERKAPPVLKPKPQTPPKTDFRSTLRSRAPAAAGGSKTEPEFKSMFGKLKPTQTQNYIAPDILKNNILSGKAGLAVTSGPQKTQRVDEFKQSILQKKEAMKADALQKKENPVTETQPSKPEPVIPEALARRKTLSKASAPAVKLQTSSNTNQRAVQSQPKPVVAPKPKVLDPEPSSTTTSTTNVSAPSPRTTMKPGTASVGNVPTGSSPNLSTKDTGSPAPNTKSISKTTRDQEAPVVAPVSVASITSEKAELPPGSKLASRLNPNLAAFLSRGGVSQSSPGKSPSPERPADGITKLVTTDNGSTEAASSGELTHMTKGRAKGPKRRAPKSQPAQAASPAPRVAREPPDPTPAVVRDDKPTPVKPIGSLKQAFVSSSPTPTTPAPRESSAISSVKVASISKDENESLVAKVKSKPIVVSKSPELRRVPSADPTQQIDAHASKPATIGRFEIATDRQTTSGSEVPAAKRELPVTPKPSSIASPLTPSKSRVNTPKPTQAQTDPPLKSQTQKPVTPSGLSVKQSPTKTVTTTNDLKAPPGRPRNPSTNVKVQQHKTSDQDLEKLISAHFSRLPDRHQKADFDAADLLSRARQPPEKIKSLAHTIMEVNGDGKKLPMPPQQDHILYEESMYLISHTFELGTAGKSSEVYLWCGDAVPNAAVEDAQLFCRKDARDYNAKLELVKQGKEPARFFQALGGILIIRRNKASSLYMLRGRRHIGHIAFDEVDLTPSGLCSGFTHLISAKFGKLYLWKGNGSGADEVGCARLIGMDLGLTGEIEEIAEGEEPASFWESFPELSEKGSWHENWQQRAQHDCYPTTLYLVDVDRSKSAGGFWGLRAASPPKLSNKLAIDMISPFSHTDLEATNVYVLDAYRSIYVILDTRATSKSAEVVTALHLAQELAMLSPSIQDRSLLPSCFVILGDPPSDVKVCFRKWSENRSAKSEKPSACIQLEQFMDALQL